MTKRKPQAPPTRTDIMGIIFIFGLTHCILALQTSCKWALKILSDKCNGFFLYLSKPTYNITFKVLLLTTEALASIDLIYYCGEPSNDYMIIN